MFDRISSLSTRLLLVFALAAQIPLAAQVPLAAQSPAHRAQIAANYGNLPLSFEANQGQSDPQVKFLSRGNGYSLFLTSQAAVLSLTKARSSSDPRPHDPRLHDPRHSESCHPERSEGPASPTSPPPDATPCATQSDAIEMQLANANPAARVAGADQLPGHASYFLGNDPAQWHTGIPTYAKVRYTGVYDGIDLVYYGNQRQLEYDFLVAPGADPGKIQLHFAGAAKLKLDLNGDLQVIANNGRIALQKPILYQEIAGLRKPVEGSFTLLANQRVSFSIARYDRTQPLVIDPILAYGTYLGGTAGDSAAGIAVDGAGDAYITGWTNSFDFPRTPGVFQTVNNGVQNAFVTKLNPSGTALVYSTYLGGTGTDNGNAIALDSSGNAYITGQTTSSNFPVTAGAFQSVNASKINNDNAFVTKLNPTGTSLLYSTYLGGASIDYGSSIAIDFAGDAYVAGTASSANFPVTRGAFQTANNAAASAETNAFVSKLNPTGTNLLYSTYLGGSGGGNENQGDFAFGIAVDKSGNAFVTGEANSKDFPTTAGAYQPKSGGAVTVRPNAFVTKLNAAGSGLIYSTYLGGSGRQYSGAGDRGYGIAVDSLDQAYVAGSATSDDFPTTAGAFQTQNNNKSSLGGPNAFVTKFDPTGKSLVYSTYLGGSGASFYGGDIAHGIALDALGDLYIAGSTVSFDFPVTKDAAQSVNNAPNTGSGNVGTPIAFVSKLSPSGSELLYSTYLGGTGDPAGQGDAATGIAVNPSGDAYLAGYANSADFPVTKGAFQTTKHGPAVNGGNAFAARFNIGDETTTTLTTSANPQTQGLNVTFTAAVSSPFTSVIPAGNVVFTINGVPVTVSLVNGAASYSTATLPQGKNAIAAEYQGNQTNSASGTSGTEVILPPLAATPIFSPAAGTYFSPVSVTVTDATKGVVIHYTIDGSTPTASSPIYSAAILVGKTTTVKAIAIASGFSNSSVASVTYTILPGAPTPVISPAGGAFTSAQLITVTDAASAAAIYYTTDGSAPTTASTKYTGPFFVGASETVQAIAAVPGGSWSTIASAAYNLEGWPTGIAAPATAVTASTATLNAFVNPVGLAGTVYFQYGTGSAALTSTTAKTALAASAKPIQFSASLSSLKANTTYYFQVVVSTAAGAVSGQVLSFTTK